MKELFPPSPPTAGETSHHQQQHPHHHGNAAVESDVSMDDLSVNISANAGGSNNHSHSMQHNTSTDSMAIASPPRTVMRSTARRSLQGGAVAAAPSSTLRSAHASRIRSRLFEEDDDEEEDDILPTALHRKPSILKPLDLNLEFASEGGGDGDNPDGGRGPPNATSPTLPSQATPRRHTLHSEHHHHHHHTTHTAAASRAPDTKTPHRPPMRKRQAEQHDLYGKNNLSFERDSHDYRSSGNDSIFSAAESPVDMYASPRISPNSPPSGGNKSVDTLHSTTNAMGRMAVYKSPYRAVRGGASNAHKSPSFIRTLDGRTVQSKNPFSPMINLDDTPNGSMNMSMDTSHMTTSASKMQVRSSPSSPTNGGNTSLFLNMSDTTPLSFPASLSGRRDSSGSSGSASAEQQREAGVLLPRHKLSQRDSSKHVEDVAVSMGMAGLAPIQSPQLHSNDPQQQDQKESYYTRDGYPEKTGRYSYTGSPIKEHLEFQPLNDNMTAASARPPRANPLDVCTNIHKIRRRTKGDDVVAAAAHGEPTWKRQGMYIYTNKDNNGNAETSDGAKSPDDNISPTDVAGFPLFRPASSDTHTLPPTPSKPVRRPPVKKYTPIRKPLGPPPTPMPAIRKARSFDHDDDDEFEDERRGFRRHSSGNTMDYLSLSPGGEGGQMLMAAAAAPAAPLSRFYSDFDTISELGNGSFGNVYKVLSRLDGCMYAIKVAHRPAKGMADKDRMLKEVYALAALSDQADTATFHIVRYHQAWMEENRLYIQTELCTTTLHAEMNQSSPMPLPLNRRYKCLREILLALEFIHKNGMVHLDIKPENVFLKNDQFKLGDFGLVSKISSHDVEEGDSRYMSMELLGGDHADLTKSDIFSLGITMYELCLGGSKPLPSNGPEWQSLRSGDVPRLPDTPEELHQIILTMMHPTYQDRPTASELLKKPQLLSDEQKMLVRERNKVWQANLALAAQSKQLERLAPVPAMPKKGLLTRRNTWSHLG